MADQAQFPVEFTWTINLHCNYRCSYCWFDGHWEEHALEYPSYPSAEQWTQAWHRIFLKYGRARISILGGEPFIFPSFIELLAALAQDHALDLTTNLSVGMPVLERMVKLLPPNSIRMGASFHPEMAEFDTFFPKVRFLNENGFPCAVLVVAHPLAVPSLMHITKSCTEANIPFTIWVYSGSYQNKIYPKAYTEEELAIVRHFIPDVGRQRYQLEQSKTRGKLCHSGEVYASIRPDGKVLRCGAAGDASGSLGNIFDPNFSLAPGPTPCPAELCRSQEYRYLQEEMDRSAALLKSSDAKRSAL